MIRRLIILLFILAVLPIGCAWENLEPDVTDKNRFWEVRMVMEDTINTNLYYIIVFNFSGDINRKPLPFLDGDDRGRFWDVYYMYGKPGDRPEVAPEPLAFYKGLGGGDTGGVLPFYTDEKKRRTDPPKVGSDLNPLDKLPELFSEQLEYIDARIISSPIVAGGPNVPNNTLYLKFNWRGFPEFPEYVNMNMLVTTLGVDELSYNPIDWDIEVIIYDSFAYNGVSIPIYTDTEFTEEKFLVEVPAADQIVLGRPASANIVDWSLIISD